MKNKKLISFLTISICFIIVLAGLYSQLSSKFYEYDEKRNLSEIEIFAKNLSKLNDSERWNQIDQIDKRIKGSKSLYFDSDLEPIYGNDPLLEYYNNNDSNFVNAKDSVYYLESYKFNQKVNIDSKSISLYFLPLSENGELKGALLIALSSTTSSYINLLRTLFIAFAVGFIACFYVISQTRDPISGFLILGLFAIVLIFIAYPILEAIRLSFMKNGELSFQTWKEVISKNYLVALWGSLKLGFLTATISTLIGFLFAFLVERTSIKGKKGITMLATMPVISPPFSLSLSIILLFGNNGLITKQLFHMNFSIYGLGGLTLVEVIGMFPIAFLTISSVLRQIDSTVEDASLDLSASKWQTFTRITLPLASPALVSAWLLVFINSLADFANPLLLSGDYRVLSTEAYIVVTGRNNLGAGSALSFLLLLPTITAFFAQRFWISRKSFVTVTGKPSTTLRDLTDRKTRNILLTLALIILAFILGLYLTIVAGCFVTNWGIDYSFTLSNWPEAISRGWSSIRDTVFLALIASPIAGILAMLAAMLIVRKKFPFKRLLEALIMTPYAIPGTLIGISYILAFNKAPILLVGTASIIIINYIIREFPVGLENGLNALHQIDPSIEEAASDLGADTTTVFRTIVLPLVRPAFLSSMSYTFVRSMTAVSAIIFLISARWNHLTVMIFNFSENLRFGLASVLSTILVVIVLSVFALMQFIVKDNKLTQKTVSTR